jgi:DNA-binding CsgD family transcriptional regulator
MNDHENDGRIDLNKLKRLVQKLFVIGEDNKETLIRAGFTSRQVEALTLFGQGKSMEEIAYEISGSEHTTNAYEALGSAIGKLFNAIIVTHAVSGERGVLTNILERGLHFKYSKFNFKWREE